MKGTIKRLIADKNFGFISSDELEQDVFFHSSVVSGTPFENLTEGMTVEFTHEQAERGPKATEVTVS